jgi:hypothetical protein
MKRYLLRLATAILAFAIGAIAARTFVPRSVPPATKPLGGEAMLISAKPHSISRRVVGYVKDQENHPVAGAKVCANSLGGSAGTIPHGVSKRDGSFTLDIWWAGSYYISAQHLTEGYPDPTNGFYGRFFGEAPVVTVDESNRLEPVEVRVGPKAGKVSFKIVDDQSGRPVESGSWRVCRTDDPRMCMDTSTAFPRGRYDLLAPEVPFTVKFEVWDKDWEKRNAVDEDGASVELVQVDQGARKRISIRLRRMQGDRVVP